MLHAEQPARLDDVLRYLRLQGLDAGEPALLAQPVHELDAHAPIIDVLREVEKVDLERERRLPGRPPPCDTGTQSGGETEHPAPRPWRSTREQGPPPAPEPHPRAGPVPGSGVSPLPSH